MAEAGKKEEQQEEKKEIRYLDKKSISGAKKMFKCDVLTGIIKRAEVKKQHFKNTKTGVITVEHYIEVDPKEFYVSARNSQDAKEQFDKIFFEIEQKIKEGEDTFQPEMEDNVRE